MQGPGIGFPVQFHERAPDFLVEIVRLRWPTRDPTRLLPRHSVEDNRS